MVLLGQVPTKRTEPQQYISQTPTPPVSPDFVQRDWGMAIGICCLVGINLWGIVKSQLTSDNDLQRELIKSLLKEREMLLSALLERKS